MIDRKLDHIIEQHYASGKNALYLTGARQVGKSYAVRKYAQAHYPVYLELNFLRDRQLCSLVNGSANVSDFFQRLSLYTRTQLVENQTFIFFDEVQVCPEMITFIKFLVEDGRYRYALSGSLLGVELSGKQVASWPVGYMTELHVYPLCFEEFIMAVGVSQSVIDQLREHWEQCTPVDPLIHQEMMRLFHLYLIVGGMPLPVDTYLTTQDLLQVEARQRDILDLYRQDIRGYNRGHELRINEIFSLIPSELNAPNKRFIIKNIHDRARYRQYADDFLWLQTAEMVLPTYNAEVPIAPLKLNEKRNLFKLFQNDVGLLACQYASGIQLRLLQGETNINYGSIYENMVAQELHHHGWNLYYFHSKSQGELDFLLERDADIIPIEVKSGKYYERHNALTGVMNNEEYAIRQAYVLCNDNLHIEGDITYAPIYMLMFIYQRQRSSQSLYPLHLPDFMK